MNKIIFSIKHNIVDYIRFKDYRHDIQTNRNITYKETGKKPGFIDMFRKCYNIKATFQDYFWFNFYNKNMSEIDAYISYGRHKEMFKLLNKEQNKKIFLDKGEFNKIFKDFLQRDFLDLREATKEEFKQFVANHKSYISKPAKGSSGFKIEKIITDSNTNLDELYDLQLSKHCYILEEIIVQHPQMSKLNPHSVNTIRVITVKNNDQVKIFKVAMRIGIGKAVVDNLSNGGMACSVDENTGKINSVGITKKTNITHNIHPISNIPLIGFQIPNFDKIKEFCLKAHKVIDMDLIGFDIAVTKEGCCIVEANSTPMYTIMQMPNRAGMYYELTSQFDFFNHY